MRLGAKDYIFKLTIKPEELIKVLDEATKDLTSKPHGADDKIVVKNLESIKYGIIDNLLIDKPCPSRQPKDVFQGLSVCVNFDKPYCCMAIRIDNYKAISARGDFPKKDLLYFTMENILSELMNRYFKAETFPYKDGIFFILYNHNNEEKTIDSVFPMLRKTIQKIFGIEISGSVSPTYQNLSQIQNAVKGSLRVINENYYCTESRFYRRCHEYETEDELDFSPLATYLNRADIRGTIDYTQKLLDELARSPRKSRQALSRMMGKVYDFLLVTMQIRGIDLDTVMDTNGLNFRSALECYDYYDDFSASANYLLKQYIEIINGSSGQQPRREVHQIQQYVQEHIQDSITVRDAAEIVNMSESRFSHIFKDETGVSFMDYLSRVRMSTAARYLNQTDMKVNEISLMVGYDNPNYFSSQFKRYLGESPVEYRRRSRCRKQDPEEK